MSSCGDLFKSHGEITMPALDRQQKYEFVLASTDTAVVKYALC
jgi:hypothetical protein